MLINFFYSLLVDGFLNKLSASSSSSFLLSISTFPESVKLSNSKIAEACKANGVYLSSHNKKFCYNNNLEIIGSAHNQEQIYQKIKQRCSLIIFSRLFKTDYKNKKDWLGINKFNFFNQKSGKIRGGPPQPLAKRKPLLTRTANAGRMQIIQGPFRQKDQIDLANAKAYDQYSIFVKLQMFFLIRLVI